jgi:hypothetical protein
MLCFAPCRRRREMNDAFRWIPSNRPETAFWLLHTERDTRVTFLPQIYCLRVGHRFAWKQGMMDTFHLNKCRSRVTCLVLQQDKILATGLGIIYRMTSVNYGCAIDNMIRFNRHMWFLHYQLSPTSPPPHPFTHQPTVRATPFVITDQTLVTQALL